MTELNKEFRPKNLKQMVGHLPVRKTLHSMIQSGTLPHCLMFHGPTGVGKTTIAGCLREELHCTLNANYTFINGALSRGIDEVRKIRETYELSPLGEGEVRIWVIDEVHKLTNDAQNGLLVPTEFTPDHVYFIFCTTDPNKIIGTLRGRFTKFELSKVPDADLRKLLNRISKKIKFKLADSVSDEIIRCSDGSAREAVNFLDAVRNTDDIKIQMGMVGKANIKTKGFQIAQALMKKSTTWDDMIPLLEDIEEEPESVRYIILGYFSKCIISQAPYADPDRAYMCIEAFRDNFYDSKKAGLLAACYDVINNGS